MTAVVEYNMGRTTRWIVVLAKIVRNIVQCVEQSGRFPLAEVLEYEYSRKWKSSANYGERKPEVRTNHPPQAIALPEFLVRAGSDLVRAA